MGYIFKTGKFNENTWLIDATYLNKEGIQVRNGHAAYLVQTESGANCLINSGSRSGATTVYESLKYFGAWPLQKLILTHSHWDHTQGVITLREKVEEEGLAPIEIFASEKAIPNLEDQSYNVCFEDEPYYPEFLNIEGVSPLKDKEKIFLDDSFSLEIIETPGHMPDHISVYDEKNKCLFVGDAPGMRWYTNFFVCNANSTYWQEKDYLESIEKMRSFDLDYLCIAHFGVFTGNDIKRFLDKSVEMYRTWMDFFNQNNEKLNDPKFLMDLMWNTVYKDFSFMPALKVSLESAIKNALKYCKGLQNK
jgi:glyoxylase-like metal-dependent hydrolase (beta-lactamase superfamily II)